MTAYFTGDSHFNHINILKYEPTRGDLWANVDEMNEALVERWNKVIGEDDSVYHVGDFAMGQRSQAPAIFDRLNGDKHIIPGNHDMKPAQLEEMGWKVLPQLYEFKVSMAQRSQRFVLCHYPLMTWNKANHGALHLHGHSHGHIAQSSTRFDVGVDGVSTWMRGWVIGAPISAEQIVDHVERNGIEYDKVDHH